MLNVTVISKVKDGKLIGNRKDLSEIVKQYEGKEVQICFSKPVKKRSHPQNRYYYGCVVPLVKIGLIDATGEQYSNEQAHELLKSEFLKQEVTLKDKVVLRTKSTTELTTAEWEIYMQECRRFAAEYLNTDIQEPNEQITIA